MTLESSKLFLAITLSFNPLPFNIPCLAHNLIHDTSVTEFQNLLRKGAVVPVLFFCTDEFISNIFLVPKKTGDLRPVINLKPLNKFVNQIHFNMENIHLACSIRPGGFVVSFDLKVAYFSAPIFPPHQKYIHFLWKVQRYEFTCLHFGYSLAPCIFTKVLKPVVVTLRLRGICLAVFIENIFAHC